MTRLALLFFCCAASARADFILLENGQRLRGEVIEQNDKEVVLLMPSVKTRLPRDKVKEIIKEDNRGYYRTEASSFLERGMYGDVMRFLERGCKQFPDEASLRGLREAAQLMQQAQHKLTELRFDDAIELIEQAARQAPQSKRVPREGEQARKTRDFWRTHGSLPGAWIETRGKGLLLLHHHPPLARELAGLIETAIRKRVEEYRASTSHRLPADARFVLMIHRSREEYLAALPDPRRHPQGLLPATDQARLVTDTRAATYQQVAAAAIEPLVARYVLIQLYQLLPLWAIEGVAAGGLARDKPAAGKPLMPASKLLAVRHYAEIEPAQRARFEQEARRLVQFFAAHDGGRSKLFGAFRKARAAMMRDIRLILKGKKKHSGSLRFESMFVRYAPAEILKAFRFKDLAALDAAHARFAETGQLTK